MKKIKSLTCRRCGFTSTPDNGRFDGWHDIGYGDKGKVFPEEHRHIDICPRCATEIGLPSGTVRVTIIKRKRGE